MRLLRPVSCDSSGWGILSLFSDQLQPHPDDCARGVDGQHRHPVSPLCRRLLLPQEGVCQSVYMFLLLFHLLSLFPPILQTYDRPAIMKPAVFPTRLLKAYSVSLLQLSSRSASVWSMHRNHWRTSPTGDRGDRGDLRRVRRDYRAQHGRFAAWPLLVRHIFLDSCGCKFSSLKPFFSLRAKDVFHCITLIYNLLQCFPSAIASHVVSEYPNKCLVSTSFTRNSSWCSPRSCPGSCFVCLACSYRPCKVTPHHWHVDDSLSSHLRLKMLQNYI